LIFFSEDEKPLSSTGPAEGEMKISKISEQVNTSKLMISKHDLLKGIALYPKSKEAQTADIAEVNEDKSDVFNDN